MKAADLAIPAIAFALGAAAVAGFSSSAESPAPAPDDAAAAALQQELANSRARIGALEAQVAQLKQEIAQAEAAPPPVAETARLAAVQVPAEAEVSGGDGEKEPEEEIAELVNSREARSLMKNFLGVMGRNSSKWIERELGKHREKLDLSDEQFGRIRDRMAAQVQQRTEEMASKLDNKDRSVQEIMEGRREQERDQRAMFEQIMKEELDADQYASYEQEQLTQRAQRIERGALRQLDQLSGSLELDQGQQDQVFGILVRGSDDYDPRMQIEGVGEAAAGDGASGEAPAQEDSIRSILTPEQLETYNRNVEIQEERRRAARERFGVGRR